MKTRNAKELASIIALLLSKDYESVMLGISLFSDHYLITNYPKNKKFKVSLKYRGYQAPSEYCRSFSQNSAEFNKNQFLRMLASKSIDINKKTCAIINFIYDNVDPRYIQKHKHKIKNPNYSEPLSHRLWGSSLDGFLASDIRPYIYRKGKHTRNPIPKKQEKIIIFDDPRNYYDRSYPVSTKWCLEVVNDLNSEYLDLNIDHRLFNGNSTPYSIIKEYKEYLANRFAKKGKRLIRSFSELERILRNIGNADLLDKYFIDRALLFK